MSLQGASETNPRGIPRAPFVTDVAQHIGGADVEVEATLKQFSEALAKYKYMESSLTQKRKGLQEKIPDIRKTLDMVHFMQEQQNPATDDDDDLDADDDGDGAKSGSIRTSFELNETLYAEADITPSDSVYLWLGANVMLSYSLEEAAELLQSKFTAAEQNLSNVEEDLEFLREQVTVMEVNTARVYNWDVRRRRDARKVGGEIAAQ
ncbi:Prefoldin, subunit 3 [Auriculariales sp. MPI-PUGE-AT-0066]|nr:Prefoldin, subunit 3 [Auriculariales sp. MPI-PUGE-AT-0066]